DRRPHSAFGGPSFEGEGRVREKRRPNAAPAMAAESLQAITCPKARRASPKGKRIRIIKAPPIIQSGSDWARGGIFPRMERTTAAPASATPPGSAPTSSTSDEVKAVKKTTAQRRTPAK